MKDYLKQILIDKQIEIKGKEAYDIFSTRKSIQHIRDMLYVAGKILVEDIDNKIYVASIRVGCMSLNEAIVVIKLQEDMVYVYSVANEGIINQRCSDKAIQKIRKELIYEE